MYCNTYYITKVARIPSKAHVLDRNHNLAPRPKCQFTSYVAQTVRRNDEPSKSYASRMLGGEAKEG
jgi:hypothetical protein